ncbi:biotin/lipoate A/B protein ligase family protein [Lacticaseibacillus baoqingensis]|uniref:Biotin/lipoate A/B protein ligase family protein n=1 Tax=Lacticaseibacillus baoqingensis TaxID=2486013 RepID=A0ABW4E874_9LACO|nr:lipoate--protein ligase family protein [Lacticaseibacillus baoqingensis]
MQLSDLTKAPIGLLSQHFTPKDGVASFAHTNALLRRPVALPEVFAHFWTLDHTVILGMQDLHLPRLSQALKALGDWHYFVRNSGGLGVVSDEAVLNFSLFLPQRPELTIATAYGLMAATIQAALPEVTITAAEITRSYCPGSFDLSIGGQKFAGLAQRRTSAGIAVMAYISVCGDQHARGELMQTFYQAGDGQKAAHFHFPDIDPAVMASLDALLRQPLTVGLMQSRLVHALIAQGMQVDPLLLPTALTQPAYQQALAVANADMHERQHFATKETL